AHLRAALRPIDHVLPHRGSLEPLPDARRAAGDLLDAEEPRCRRTRGARRLRVLRLVEDPLRRSLPIRDLDDRATAVGVNRGTRTASDDMPDRSGQRGANVPPCDAVPVQLGLQDLAHLRRARDLIDREYARPLDVPAMARAAHASPSHFARQYKAAFGE